MAENPTEPMPSNEKEGFVYVWKVKNFSHCPRPVGQMLKSPTFKLEDNSEWSLGLYPRGYREGGYLALYLLPCKISLPKEVTFELTALNVKCEETVFSVKNYEFDINHGQGCGRFLSRDCVYSKNGRGFLKNDTLTLCCRVWNVNGSIPKLSLCYATTWIGINVRSFIWEIPDFVKVQEKKTIKFESISKEDVPLTVIFQKEKRGGYFPKTFGNIDIIVSRTSAMVYSSCKLSVLDIDDKEINCKRDEFLFTAGLAVWRFPAFIDVDEIKGQKERLLPQGVLTLLFDMNISNGTQHDEVRRFEGRNYAFKSLEEIHKYAKNKTSPIVENSEVLKEYSLLKNEFFQLYSDHKFCDFSLQTEKKTFAVHRAVLRARSPVFKAMLDEDMEENRTGVVKISDLDTNAVQGMLVFIYSNQVCDMNSVQASRLYFAADKYDLKTLKEKCAKFIINEMDSSNVCQALALADMHSDQGIMSSAKKFVLLHAEEVISSGEWENFMKDNASLAAKIMHFLFMTNLGR